MILFVRGVYGPTEGRCRIRCKWLGPVVEWLWSRGKDGMECTNYNKTHFLFTPFPFPSSDRLYNIVCFTLSQKAVCTQQHFSANTVNMMKSSNGFVESAEIPVYNARKTHPTTSTTMTFGRVQEWRWNRKQQFVWPNANRILIWRVSVHQYPFYRVLVVVVRVKRYTTIYKKFISSLRATAAAERENARAIKTKNENTNTYVTVTLLNSVQHS